MAYQSVEESIVHESVHNDGEHYNYAGCECYDCSAGNCPCLHNNIRVYDGSRRLLILAHNGSSDFQNPVIECNDSCLCSIYCYNRVIQLGSTSKLECFKTQAKGLGVRCKDRLLAGQFVCEYLGEIVSIDEAKSRFALYNPTLPNYVCILREHITTLSNQGIISTCIDATKFGNIGRFINHSCAPNLLSVPVRINTDIPHLAFFAKRDIAANEEITFDYSGGYNDNRTQPIRYNIKCLCGSQDCTGYLPYDSMLFDEIE